MSLLLLWSGSIDLVLLFRVWSTIDAGLGGAPLGVADVPYTCLGLPAQFCTNKYPNFVVSFMDPSIRCLLLIIRDTALVAVISAWLFIRFRRISRSRRHISYGPMSARDRQRANNLRIINHSDDSNCVELLRMKRVPFSSYAT